MLYFTLLHLIFKTYTLTKIITLELSNIAIYFNGFDEKAVQEVFKQVRKDLGLLDVDDDVIAQLLDESISVWDNDFNYSHSYDDDEVP